MIVFTALGCAIFTLAVVAGLIVGIGHLTTSEHDKQQIGGIDLSWYAGAFLLGVPAGLTVFLLVLTGVLR